MARELRGKVLWLEAHDFQEKLLPQPPPAVMPSDSKLRTISKAFEEMMDTYAKDAALEGRKPEDVLAEKFVRQPCNRASIIHLSAAQVTIVNTHILDYVAKKEVPPLPETKKPARGARGRVVPKTLPEDTASRIRTRASASSSNTPPDKYSPQSRLKYRRIVPSYRMHLCLNHADTNDPGENKADAAIFRSDAKLESNRPNWVHQRLPTEFKVRVKGNKTDAFEDHRDRNTQPVADQRSKVFGQLTGYSRQIFVYQHRTAVFQLFVVGNEFRFLRWDKSGVFVTQKVDYVTNTRTLVEFIIGFLIIDDASQGIDTTATLLGPKSKGYKIMDEVAERGAPADVQSPPVIVAHEEGTILPSHIPVTTVAHNSSSKNAGESEVVRIYAH